jgi:hypothetical protein
MLNIYIYIYIHILRGSDERMSVLKNIYCISNDCVSHKQYLEAVIDRFSNAREAAVKNFDGMAPPEVALSENSGAEIKK